MRYALISIKPEYVEAIIDGNKIYELRRRKPNLSQGDHLIIYETSPGKKVAALAEIDSIIDRDLTDLWETVNGQCAVTFDKFLEYFQGCDSGYALKLRNVRAYKQPLTLEDLRGYLPKYTPPQFFHYLNEDHPLFRCLTTSI